MKEALLYKKKKDKRVQCYLCAHRCEIGPGSSGFCRVRLNKDGVLYSLTYEKLAAAGIDPIEKKPLYHFYPGMESYSISTPGCNFRCEFCQNASLAQVEEDDVLDERSVSVKEVVADVLRRSCPSISYTYSEPTIYFEYALEIAREAAEHGIKNILVSNGYQTPECIDEWAPYTDAINIDLKSFRDEFYRKYCKASLQPVLDSIKKWNDSNAWMELTSLIIPGLNDSEEEINEMIDFVLSLGDDTVWHISRFAPAHKMFHHSATPVKELFDVYEKALSRGLKYVYLGNILDERTASTYCPGCSRLLISRTVFSVNDNFLDGGKCSYCGLEIAGRFDGS